MSKTSTFVRPRAALEAMGEYHPPLANRTGLRLDFNENILAPSPRVLERLAQFGAEDLIKYPEREPVERVVAQHLSLRPEQILLTNGVDEGIHLISTAFLDAGDEVVIVTPTFAMYQINAEAAGAVVRKVQAGSDFQFPFERVLAAINGRTKMIWLPTPNNPTGSVILRKQILRVAEAAPHAAVIVDEAYYHFFGESVLDVVGDPANLLLTRTFSKVYGLAGLRVGLVAGHEDALRFIRKVCSPYNVNALGLACVAEAIADKEYVAWYVDQVHRSRAALESELTALGVRFWPSQANFVLMFIGPKHKEFVAAMRECNVLVRDRSTDPGCDGCVRISVGPLDQTQRGVEAIREALQKIGWRREYE